MKYQAIKHNKTGSRLMMLCDTLSQAQFQMTKKGALFNGLSYVGNFPTFMDEKHRLYSIQGAVEIGNSHVVCSLDKKEMEMMGWCA
jgi:hypothetical protein